MVQMILKALALLLCLTYGITSFAGEHKKRDGVCPADPKAFANIEAKAAAGDAQAEFALASCYELGRNVAPSRAETIHWLGLAAVSGYAPAQYELGRIYLYGRGVPADYSQALLWETRAALQGEPKAQCDVAYMYEQGLGMVADAAQAAAYNRKAATQGVAEAQLRLGLALEAGAGVDKSIHEATLWYTKAATQDLPAAQLRLAQLSAGNQSCMAAVSWYKRAAGNGEAQAMYELGRLYLAESCGVNRDQAWLWLRLAGRYGLRPAQQEADDVASRLTADQRKKGERAAENWIRKHSGARAEQEDDGERKKP